MCNAKAPDQSANLHQEFVHDFSWIYLDIAAFHQDFKVSLPFATCTRLQGFRQSIDREGKKKVPFSQMQNANILFKKLTN